MSQGESTHDARSQTSAKPVLIALTAFVLGAGVVLLAQHGRTSKYKEFQHSLFYIGMTSDEALKILPPGCELAGLGLLHDRETDREHPNSVENNFRYWIRCGEDNYLELYFNYAKRLEAVGWSFDEEKFVSLYAERQPGGRRKPSGALFEKVPDPRPPGG
jgi:hypothetical protein